MKHEIKDGEYFYFPNGNMYAVYLNHISFGEDGTKYENSDKVADCLTKQQAKEKVYNLNGWNKNRK